MKRNIFLILMCLSLLFAVEVLGSDETLIIKQQIQNFLQRELDGDACTRDDELVAEFNPKLKKQIANDPGGACIYLNADNLHIVTKCEIKTIEVKGNKGHVIVEFQKLAEITGSLEKRRITELNRSEQVRYNLIKKKGKWLVYDPPEMRVTLNPIKRYYRSVAKLEKSVVAEHSVSLEQKRVFNANKAIFGAISSLGK